MAGQLARIKSPRYALGFIVGGLYFWFLFLRPGASPALESGGISETMASVIGIGVMVTVLFWWLWGGVSGSLAFQPAEVQLLFPAPVSRRWLIGYKVARSQLLLVLNALIWTLLIRSWGLALGAPARFATAWAFFSLLALHRLGAALVQVTPARGARWVALQAGRALAAAALLALAAGVGPVFLEFGRAEIDEVVRAAGAALAVPPAAYAYAPFRLLMAPLTATSPEAWAPAFAVVFGIVVLHVGWVLAVNVEFEEAAAVASEALAKRMAAFRQARAGGAAAPAKVGKVARNWLPLAPTGWPATALIWKNTMSLIRTGMLRTGLVVLGLLLVMSYVFSNFAGGRGGVAVAVPFAFIGVMVFVLGPRLVRNDLRQDLLSLASLKSYPLSGAAVVGAEMVSPTLALSALQFAILVIGFYTLPYEARLELDSPAIGALFLLAPFLLVALNGASVGIQNAIALLFPAWVRLGADPGGFEATGQFILVAIGSMFALALTLVLPAVLGIAVFFLAKPAIGGMAVAAAAVAGLVVLSGEIVLLVLILGGMFEKTDPTALS